MEAFFKTKKKCKSFQTNNVRQLNINIHFESNTRTIPRYEYGENEERRQGFLFLESFITIFAFEENLERFALQFGVPDTRA